MIQVVIRPEETGQNREGELIIRAVADEDSSQHETVAGAEDILGSVRGVLLRQRPVYLWLAVSFLVRCEGLEQSVDQHFIADGNIVHEGAEDKRLEALAGVHTVKSSKI